MMDVKLITLSGLGALILLALLLSRILLGRGELDLGSSRKTHVRLISWIARM